MTNKRGYVYYPRKDSSPAPREKLVLTLLCQGKSPKQIYRSTGVSRGSISEYVRRLKCRAGCKTLIELGIWAFRNGYTDSEGTKDTSVAQARSASVCDSIRHGSAA